MTHTDPDPCGTYGAYQRHRRRREPIDEACAAAAAWYRAGRHATRRADGTAGTLTRHRRIRRRALARLIEAHPDEYDRLYAEETALDDVEGAILDMGCPPGDDHAQGVTDGTR